MTLAHAYQHGARKALATFKVGSMIAGQMNPANSAMSSPATPTVPPKAPSPATPPLATQAPKANILG